MKTSELIGKPLNWAVARCLNVEMDEQNVPIWFDEDGLTAHRAVFDPQANWAQGGPIIEREWIKCDPRKGQWEATIWNEAAMQNPAFGPTPLIAAMRCYVASKWGDEVDIPEELQ